MGAMNFNNISMYGDDAILPLPRESRPEFPNRGFNKKTCDVHIPQHAPNQGTLPHARTQTKTWCMETIDMATTKHNCSKLLDRYV